MNRFQNERELILFCDESISKGEYYSNFYGGVLVPATQYMRISQYLSRVCEEHGIRDEVKWQKCTEQRLEPYKKIIDAFFDELIADNLRVRIMFRQNALIPLNLTDEHKEKQYYMLYYQFIKHAFNLNRFPSNHEAVKLRLYFDQFPDTRDSRDEFKKYLLGLDSRHFSKSPISIAQEDITEVKSHDHVILQCLDVVLGSMAFMLNDNHKKKAAGAATRGKRTVAKEKLYKHIRSRIVEIKPNFNIGVSTGGTSKYPDYMDLPYAHWVFTPKSNEYHGELTKEGKRAKKYPTKPT